MELYSIELRFFSSLDWDTITKTVIGIDDYSLHIGSKEAMKHAHPKEDKEELIKKAMIRKRQVDFSQGYISINGDFDL